MSDGDGEQQPDRTDEKLTPEEAYNLTENKGFKGKTVAKMFGVSSAYVSQQKSSYKTALNDGRQEGRNSVTASDFDQQTLENALNDKRDDEDVYECQECGKEMDYMEYEQCPNCGTKLGWNQL